MPPRNKVYDDRRRQIGQANQPREPDLTLSKAPGNCGEALIAFRENKGLRRNSLLHQLEILGVRLLSNLLTGNDPFAFPTAPETSRDAQNKDIIDNVTLNFEVSPEMPRQTRSRNRYFNLARSPRYAEGNILHERPDFVGRERGPCFGQ